MFTRLFIYINIVNTLINKVPYTMLSFTEVTQRQKDNLHKLIAWTGSQSRLAKQLGVSRQTVNNWISRGRISATAAIEVDRKTDGLFKKEDLRPDVVQWLDKE
jgi:DNA-binding transcriptional regulator YdaS (Cro superfamily)